MSDQEKGVDLVGLGKLAEAIPEESWVRATEMACRTLESCLSPITHTTSGLGKLINVYFDRMADVQKVYAAEAIRKASEKVEASRSKDREARGASSPPKSMVLIAALSASGDETDATLREIWSNLIANEVLHASVHPDFPNLLNRLSASDALTLAEIAERNLPSMFSLALRALVRGYSQMLLGIATDERTNASHEHLKNLGLIRKHEGLWTLSLIGSEFIKAVSDPTLLR